MTLNRPLPPESLIGHNSLAERDIFEPAPDLVEWIRSAYLAEDGPLYSNIHNHLRSATIGALWTNAPFIKQQRQIVGMAEMPMTGFRGSRWAKGRAEQQLFEWFDEYPDFLLTFDAYHALNCNDATFCALVDHELCHCGQKYDEFGMPKFNKQNGLPEFAMRGHDVSEFISVVQRFGIQAAGPQAVDFVIAAAQPPEIAMAEITNACGTCVRMAA